MSAADSMKEDEPSQGTDQIAAPPDAPPVPSFATDEGPAEASTAAGPSKQVQKQQSRGEVCECSCTGESANSGWVCGTAVCESINHLGAK